jgi:hypothetical protein
MFKTIKVTTLSDKKSIYINIDMIGHLYEVEEKDFNREPKKYTVIGTTTHNNGGFKVIESVEEVFKRIKAEE